MAPYRVPPAVDSRVQIARIEAIGSVGTHADVRELLPFITLDDAFGVAARAAADAVIARTSPVRLGRLGAWVRGDGFSSEKWTRDWGVEAARGANPGSSWLAIRPSDVDRIAGARALDGRRAPSSSVEAAPTGLGFLALASFHADGYVRERAVVHLASMTHGLELPLLLLRANDWVEPVRKRALAALHARITGANVDAWVRALGLLDRLDRLPESSPAIDPWPFERSHHVHRNAVLLAELVARVDALLRAEAAATALANAVDYDDATVRRAALRLVVGCPAERATPLLHRAARDRDPAIAYAAASALLARATPADAIAVVDALAGHRLGRVRFAALETALRFLGACAPGAPSVASADRITSAFVQGLLDRALFDEARAVRELARHASSSAGAGILCDHASFAPRYREALRSTVPRLSAIEGLAEVGDARDVPFFATLLAHPSARVRAAAILGLGRLAGDEHHDALEAALVDPSPRVARAALPSARRAFGRRRADGIGASAASPRRR